MNPEIEKTIIGAINTLKAFLNTDYTTKEMAEHVDSQVHLMAVLNFQNSPALFDYIEEASFEELYAAQNLISDYIKWLFSPWEPELILELHKKVMDSPMGFKKLETAALTYRAIYMESATEWWFNTFDAVLRFQVGNKADFRLSKIAAEQSSDADKVVYTYGNFKTLLAMGFLGFSELCTKNVEVEFLNLFEKAKYRKNIPVTRYEYSDDKFDFLKAHETVGKWNPKEALKMLCDGSLFNFTRHRTYDRMTDTIMEQKTARRGGKSPKEIGEKIRKLRLDKNMSIEELVNASGKTKEFITNLEQGDVKKVYETTIMPIVNILEADINDIMGKVRVIKTDFQDHDDEDEKTILVSNEDQADLEADVINKELISLILNILPESSTEYKIVKYRLQEPDISFQEIADREGMSERGIRKAWERVKKQAITALSEQI